MSNVILRDCWRDILNVHALTEDKSYYTKGSFMRNYDTYSNPSVYKQLVYELSLVRDAQINTCFSICKPIFAYTSSFLSQTDRCSCREVMGN
jgi:hypothetical protein